ncbi:hypothetical protein ScPMuIL_017963 [Solemya velum]
MSIISLQVSVNLENLAMNTRENSLSNAIAILPSSIQVQKNKSNITPGYSAEKKPVQVASKNDVSSKSTILVRQPLPKYSFQVNSSKKTQRKKVAKHSVISKELSPIENIPSLQETSSQLNSDCSASTISTVDSDRLPTTQSDYHGTLNSTSKEETVVSSEIDKSRSGNEKFGEKPVKRVGPLQSTNSVIPTTCIPGTMDQSKCVSELLDVSSPSDSHCSNSRFIFPEMETIKKENTSLQTQLDLQLQVNAELKKLLVASVGEDLEHRVENLARDRAELTKEVGGYMQRMTEGYEHIDQVSIQADMWRSKFLASRMMVDDLARARAFYALQYQESQNALQQLLNERHELRSNMMECYRNLLTVKSAFDPLNSQKSMVPVSVNSIDIVKANKQLAETIKFRLLPSNISLHCSIDTDLGWQHLTNAEVYAQEVISRRFREPDFQSHAPFERSAQITPPCMTVDRFHPSTRFDNLTFNCCEKCKGDILVV